MKFNLSLLILTATLTTIPQSSLAQVCAPVNITSLSQNYLPLYHELVTGHEVAGYPMAYGPIRLTASNAYQSINGHTVDCAGEGAYAGPTLNYVENVQDVYTSGVSPQNPFPIGSGYNDYYWTVYDFTTVQTGKQNLWVLTYDINGNYVPSNAMTFWVDEPAYMVVVTDNTFAPQPPDYPNVWRQVIYEVHNTSGSLAPQINIGETATYTQSSPPCSKTVVLSTSLCSEGGLTSTYGKFTDTWAITESASPSGCGVDSLSDHWQACSPSYKDDSFQHTLPVLTFGTLTGYLHTNSVDIRGYITTPNEAGMPTGLRIYP
jgi:hypothetical protein